MTKQADIDLGTLKSLWPDKSIPLWKIGETLGVSKSVVSHYARIVLGLPARELGSKALPALRVEALYREGISAWRIGMLFGVSSGAVIRLLRSRKVAVKPYRVADCPWLGPCVRLRRQGLSYRKIAKQLGISPEMVENRCVHVLGRGKWGGARVRD